MKTIRTAFKNGADKSTYNYTSSWGECPMAARPAFPLSVSQPDYWTYFPGALEDVRQCLYGTDGLRDKLEEATRERNDAKACMDALEAAIKAAKEALACKTK
jgi:hypothetical protein